MSFLGPSERVRNLFRQYVTNTMASEGEPAALGKSASGPVYYTDDDGVIHKNRVWFRKGANKEIVGVARADNQGVPDVPDLPTRVAKRFGMYWVVDWQRENPAAEPTPNVHWLNAAMLTDASPAGSLSFDPNGAPGYELPYWALLDSTSVSAPGNGVNAFFIALASGTQLDITVFWTAEDDGDWAARIYDAYAIGDENSFFYSQGFGEDVNELVTMPAFQETEIKRWEVTVTLNTAIDAGDPIFFRVSRIKENASDTISDTIKIFGVKVVIT